LSFVLDGELRFRQAAVTGATGFVGTHLIKLLVERGVNVRALARRDLPWMNRNVKLVRGDVRNSESVRTLVSGVDVVFHTAALVTPWVRRPSEQYEINVGGTKCVLEAAERFGTCVVCTSSIVVLNPFPPPLWVCLLDGNHYVKSKRQALEIVRGARERGVQASSVLPSGIVGPIDHRPTNLGKVIRKTIGSDAPYLSFAGGLHLIDVRDVAEAHLLAALALPGDYVLPGEYWSLNDLYSSLRVLAEGSTGCRFRVPVALVVAGSACLTAWSSLKSSEAPVITPAWVHYVRQAASMHYPDDSTKLSLRRRSVSDALKDAVAWFLRSDSDV
jgi:dihydroflavonol-4-reductase